MVADADAVELKNAFFFRDRDEGEIGGAAADVADQYDVAGANLRAPILAGLGSPCVKRRERLLQQNDLPETGRLCGLGGQVSCNFVEGCGDGQNNLGVR